MKLLLQFSRYSVPSDDWALVLGNGGSKTNKQVFKHFKLNADISQRLHFYKEIFNIVMFYYF